MGEHDQAAVQHKPGHTLVGSLTGVSQLRLVVPMVEWMNDTRGKPTGRNGETGAGRSVSGSEHTADPLPSHWT
jgi:hypothetical protein